MTRQFLGLYSLIVITLAAVSWGQDKLLQLYGDQASEDKALSAAMLLFAERLEGTPVEQRAPLLVRTARTSGVNLELIALSDIAGRDSLPRLQRGEIVYMQAAGGQLWVLKQIDQRYVLALKTLESTAKRSPLEWAATLLFYAAIGLVIMIWIWPLRRDLQELERSADSYGDRNWRFNAKITPRSQIYPLAQTFRLMAARIDGLIASHKDMSNAVSHEIKTPLSRMKFEIELAQQAGSLAEVGRSLNNIKGDIAAINNLVRATMEYAILERADVELNIARHDFTTLVPAIVQYVQRDVRSDLQIALDIQPDATHVRCDMHLFESVLKNLIYNAVRYARREIRVTFRIVGERNQLLVEDDGPGIPEKDRQRVFESFVQLDKGAASKVGYGLGLAIVKRTIEWHSGEISASQSPLGGARFDASWPSSKLHSAIKSRET